MITKKLKTANYIFKNKLIYQKTKFNFSNQQNSGKQKSVYENLDSFKTSETSQNNSQQQLDIQGNPIQKDQLQDLDQYFDIAIIGGGSGGLSLALEAKKLGLKPIIFDYVDKSNQNYHWGIGGTCVNVGCIPKKLMHIASSIKDTILDGNGYGWNLETESQSLLQRFNWKQMVYNIRKYLLDTNIFYEMKLNEENIPYINAFATLHDKNTVVYSQNKDNIKQYLTQINQQNAINYQDQQQMEQEDALVKNLNLKSISARYIVLSTGGRPNLDLKTCPDIKNYAMTSDDFFFNQKKPGKTLVVGGGYIALECAGILSQLGNQVTVMTKDKYLRGFDQQMANNIVEDLKNHQKVEFVPTSLPIHVEKKDLPKQKPKKKKKKEDFSLEEEPQNYVLNVKYQNQKTQEISDDTFDSILLAIGRNNNTDLLNLKRVGVQYNEQTKEIIGNFNGEFEQTSVPNIFAIGDILQGAENLTPLAQKSAKYLAKRIFYKNMAQAYRMDTQKEQDKYKISYDMVPTTVFTPLEYSFVGLSEEQAREKYGNNKVTIYHSRYIPLDQTLSENIDLTTFQPNKKKAYIKLICDKENDEKILGMHYIGPQAGEIMQGFSVMMNFSKELEKQYEIQNQQQQQQQQQKEVGFFEQFFGNSEKQEKKQVVEQSKLIFNKQFLDKNIGIHPTLAEEFVNLTKKQEENPDQESC